VVTVFQKRNLNYFLQLKAFILTTSESGCQKLYCIDYNNKLEVSFRRKIIPEGATPAKNMRNKIISDKYTKEVENSQKVIDLVKNFVSEVNKKAKSQ
jgi:hypothetical protein